MYLTIDLGSTSFKASIFSRKLSCVAEAKAFPEYIYGDDGKVEITANSINKSFNSLFNSLREKSPDILANVKAIGITSQAQTFAFFDGQHTPTSNFISWQDSRAFSLIDDLTNQIGENALSRNIYKKSFSAGSQAALLYWFKVNNNKILNESRHIWNLPTWLLWKLTGAAAIDTNIAAMSGMYSHKTEEWWNDFCIFCSEIKTKLPQLKNIGTIAGTTTTNNWGLMPDIPVYMCGNDQTANAYGADLHTNDKLLLTLGTAGVAYKVVESLPGNIDGGICGPYPDDKYYFLRANNCCGNLISWACRNIPSIKSFEDFFSYAAKYSPSSNPIVFIPDENKIGGKWNILSTNANPEELAHSILCAISEKLIKLTKDVCFTCQEDFNNVELIISGGGSINKIWVEMLSKIAGKKPTVINTSPNLGAVKMIMKTNDRMP